MGLCLQRVTGIDPLVLWPNFHCFKRVDCQFTVVKEFDSNFKLCFDDNDQGAKKVILQLSISKNCKRLILKRLILTSLKNIMVSGKKKKKLHVTSHGTLSLLACFFK